MDDLRAQAESFMEQGAPLIAAAFNLTGSRGWIFDPDTKARAEGLLRELVELFHEGEIEDAWSDAQVRAHAEGHRRFWRLLAVREDEAFKIFMLGAQTAQDGPVGPLHRQLRGAGRSEAAKRTWARRKAQG